MYTCKHEDYSKIQQSLCWVISGCHHKVTENCILLGFYTVGSGNCLLIFQNNQSVPFSGFKNPKESLLPQGVSGKPVTPYRVYFPHMELIKSNSVWSNRLAFGFLNPKDGTDRLSWTSVRNHNYPLRNNPEERSSLSLPWKQYEWRIKNINISNDYNY